MKAKTEKIWHGTFELSVFIKAFDGILEILSGIVLVFISPATMQNILMRLGRGELAEDPQDFFMNYAHNFLQHLSVGTKTFAGLYILAHGLLNMILIIGLLKQQAWAYMLAIGVISSFILFQLYRISIHPSIFLEVLTVFDTLFIILTWHEYKSLKNREA